MTMNIVDLLHRAAQIADEAFAEAAVEAKLTPRQFSVLRAVASKPGISQTGLVEVTGIDRSTLADIVKRLVGKRLLCRVRTKADARMYSVKLTDEGSSVLTKAAPSTKAVEERLLGKLTNGDRIGLLSGLENLISNADIERKFGLKVVGDE